VNIVVTGERSGMQHQRTTTVCPAAAPGSSTQGTSQQGKVRTNLQPQWNIAWAYDKI